MARSSRLRTLCTLGVTVALAVPAAIVWSAPAQAGDVPPPYFLYADAELAPGGEVTSSIVAQRVGRPADSAYPLTGGTVVSYAPSVSRDGRVLAFARFREPAGESSGRVVVQVDGRTVLRIKEAASLAAVTPDGSAVTWVDTDGGVRAYRVATGEQVTLCDDCAPGGSYAALSPDGRKIALRVAAARSDTDRVVIRRLSDLRALGRSPGDVGLVDPTVAWSPDSRQVAYSIQRFNDDLTLGTAIRTLTTSGTVGRTAFDSLRRQPGDALPPVYVSPAWVNGAVWAIRLDFPESGRARVVPVSAATWQDTPVAGAPLTSVPDGSTAILAGLGSWATSPPVPTLGSGVGCIPPRVCSAGR
jgi:hypothetical protein